MSRFEGTDLDEFVEHFKLQELRGIFDDLGASSLDDLGDIYSSDELMDELVKLKTDGKIKLIAFNKFIKAAKLSSCFDDLELCSQVAGMGTAIRPMPPTPPSVTRSHTITATTTATTEGPSMTALLEEARREVREKEAKAAKAAAKLAADKREFERLKLTSATFDAAAAKSERERVSVHDKIMKTAERKRLIKEAELNLQQAASVDVCLTMDGTGSMDSHRDAAVANLTNIANEILGICPDITVRFAVVVYRDHCDGADRLAVKSFTPNVQEVKEFLASQLAFGGGDGPEDIMGAINVMNNTLVWSSATKVIFHIGDAPCHGSRFHNIPDDYPDGDPHGLQPEILLPALKLKGVQYFFGQIGHHTDQMIRVFNTIMGHEFINKLEVSDATKMMDTLTTTMITTITPTLSSSASTGKTTKAKVEVVIGEPNWASIPISVVRRQRLLPPIAVAQVLASQDLPLLSATIENVNMKVAKDPFGAGGCNVAHYAQEIAGGKVVDKVANKVSLSLDPKYKTKEEVVTSIDNHYTAMCFANEFNAVLPARFPKVEYIPVSLICSGSETYGTQEPLIAGTFMKYNNNKGMILKPCMSDGVDHSVVQAFSHYTYHISHHAAMVVDCQGVFDRVQNKFSLTDPVVLSTDMTRYGRTNFSTSSMKKFFMTHTCNACCTALELPASDMSK